MSRGKVNDLIETNGWPWLLDTLSTLADNEADMLFRSEHAGLLPAIKKLRRLARQLHRASLECESVEMAAKSI